MITVDHRHLTVVAELGTGGLTTVVQVTGADRQLPAEMAFAVPGKGLGPDTAELVLGGMYKAVGLRDRLEPAELAELDSFTTWPLAMVARDGRFVGSVSRLIDRDYYMEARPAGRQPTMRLFELQMLCASAEQLLALGIAPPPAEDGLVRLALMARLAYGIEVIHRPRGSVRLVYGDLNLRDVAVAVNPPRIMLLGTDGVADANDGSRRQPNTPFFVPPELASRRQALQDQLTDVYKLGLCVIRGLATGRGATQVTDPASPLVRQGLLDRAGVSLLGRAVGADRSQRPTAEEIKDYLIGRILHLADRRE
jgi:hypothetical protein